MADQDQGLKASDLIREADGLEDLVRVMSEAGLCSKKNPDCLASVLNGLDQGRRSITSRTLPEAKAAILAAWVEFNAVVKSRSWWWRMIFVHRALIFLYLVGCLVLLLNVASGYFNWVADEFWHVPMSAMGAGALGAVLRALYWLHRQVARRIFRAQFALAYLAAPVIGLLFGMFTYLLIKGGLLVLQDGQTGDLESATGLLALSFLAGFSWEWILGWVAKRFGGGNGPAAPAAEEDAGQPNPKSPAAVSDPAAEEAPSEDPDPTAAEVQEAVDPALAEAKTRGEEVADSFVQEIVVTASSLKDLPRDQRLVALQTLAQLAVRRRAGTTQGSDVTGLLALAAKDPFAPRAKGVRWILSRASAAAELEEILEELRSRQQP